MFETSASTEKLDQALAKAQGQISVASKDKLNPHFRSKYADIASVWEACRDALSSNGISITQWPIASEDNSLHLITRIACGGEWMQGRFRIPVSKQDAHGYASAITYAKRLTLSAVVGIVSAEDDDGNAAVGRLTPATPIIHPVREAAPPAPAHVKPKAPVTDADYVVPVGLSKGVRLSEVPKENLQGAISMLEQKLAVQKENFDPVLFDYLERAKRFISSPKKE